MTGFSMSPAPGSDEFRSGRPSGNWCRICVIVSARLSRVGCCFLSERGYAGGVFVAVMCVCGWASTNRFGVGWRRCVTAHSVVKVVGFKNLVETTPPQKKNPSVSSNAFKIRHSFRNRTILLLSRDTDLLSTIPRSCFSAPRSGHSRYPPSKDAASTGLSATSPASLDGLTDSLIVRLCSRRNVQRPTKPGGQTGVHTGGVPGQNMAF